MNNNEKINKIDEVFDQSSINDLNIKDSHPCSAPPVPQSAPFFHHNKRTSSSNNFASNSNHNNNNNRSHRYHQHFHRTQTEGANLNHSRQQNHQNSSRNQLIDKYNRNYNLVSFILLRKHDNLFTDEKKVYLNDQLLFNLVKNFIQNLDFNSICSLFKQNKTIPNHKNSYNSSLFTYTIREALDFVGSRDKTSNNGENFIENLFKFLFENELPNEFGSLNDGDYPMRNIMHYAAHYDSILLLKLIFKHLKPEETDKICLLTDFNGDTPMHIAVQHDSKEFIHYIYENKKTIFDQVNFDYAYNYDGLNLILLACKYSSLEVIKLLHEKVGLSLNFKELNQNSLKTCLHVAILRTVDRDTTYLNTYNIIKYLYGENNYLPYELSPLVGSVYHIAASNLTRIHLLWFLLNEYNEKIEHFMNNMNECINSVDFREYSCIDCFIDTLISTRAIIPANETVYSFYIKYHFKSEDFIHFKDENSFELLIKKCLFKLVTKCKATITKLPQIRTQIELLQFIKLLKFMSKFHFKLQTKFDSIYFTKFEAFCLKFLNTFIFTGDLLPIFSTSVAAVDMDQNNNNIQAQQVNETFLSVFNELIELTKIIMNSGYFTHKFQHKIYSFMCDYFSNLNQQYDKFSIANESKQPKLLEKFSNELNLMNKRRFILSLKDLCRYEINYCLFNNNSKNSKRDSIYFQLLPLKNNIEILNFLTFNLINDLFGSDIKNVLNDFEKDEEELFRYI